MSDTLRISGLRKHFAEVEAVRGVSLEVQPGEVVALLGPNGSGKTTTIRCAAGLLRPTAGTIRVSGCDLQRDYRRARRRFTYLPQQAQFQPTLTVLEVARFHSGLRGLGPAAASAALESCGLPAEAFERPTGKLSGGMRQRLALAVASLGEPDLMLFDEPTANLDPQGALDFRAAAQGWRQAGRAILLCTHVLADVETLADRVIVLVDGAAVASEPIGGLRQRLARLGRLRVNVGHPRPEYISAAVAAGAVEAKLNCQSVLVTAPPARRMAIVEGFAHLGPVFSFDTEQPSLEDVYLEYISAAQASGEDSHAG